MNKNTNTKIVQKHITTIILNLTQNVKNNLITITNIKISKNFDHVTVYLSILKNKDEILKQLIKSSKYIKYNLAIKIKKYKIPNVDLILDKTINYEDTIENLIQKTKK